MIKQVHLQRIIVCAVACLGLSACHTVSIPKIDIMKSPEFAEDAANVAKDYPRVKDLPVAPTDTRSDAQWDRDARAMQALRDAPSPYEVEPGLSAAETEARYEVLKAKAQAYKKDDPATGPVQGFPDYKPRR